jgi:hypothetical protein
MATEGASCGAEGDEGFYHESGHGTFVGLVAGVVPTAEASNASIGVRDTAPAS